MRKEVFSFDKLNLKQELKRIFGFNKFKGQQEEVIKSLMEGNDTFVIMPTGGGKSLCYQLPALIQPGCAIIVSPLISLMKNQVDAIRNFGSVHGVAHFLNSSLSKNEIRGVRADLRLGVTKLLYVAPESLNKEENAQFLKSIKISFFAIDEAHCISEWGHDFRPEYRRLKPIIDSIGKKAPIIALTATATPKVQQDIMKNLEMTKAKVFISSFNRPNLYYEIRQKPKKEVDVNREVIRFIKENSGKSGVIYCLSRKTVEGLAETLVLNGIKALPYHAGLDPNTRAMNQDKFLMEEVDVIVATIAFGMGIDKPDVRFVIHYDMPKSLEGYYQETGRAGRDDGEGKCIAFYSEQDINKLEKFLVDKPVAEREVALQLMNETISYCESSACRRINLLQYFGENYDLDNCGSCDNCLNPKPRTEASDDIELVLETVLEVKQILKAIDIANILTSVSTGQTKAFKNISNWGAGEDKKFVYWKAVIRQAIIEGLLIKEIENYGVLKITQEGHKFLKKKYPILVSEDHDYSSDNKNEDNIVITTEVGEGGDKILFTILKDLRKKIATKENLPPYVIFEDRSLEDMTVQYPINMEEMHRIIGVGVSKAQKYGEEFLKIIKKYVEDNEIERPHDLVVRSIVNKSGLKVYIIKCIDKKLPLEDIAVAKSLEVDELLKEIERIVASGTKLDLSYYVDEVVDPYHQEEILELLRENQTDNIKDILEELGEEEYTEEEVRLMRIIFLSKYGN
ncbi:MAG: DNA helicase RecQ [Bacteroidales bacterium]|jgi:ATP-dependent DNA helicase RecQ|nr:DNA helicase RecQ [Bacteroidales bacterium]MDY0053481.1 DNA helicase RecQ [Bacteroidales bacterium]